jgi:chemotaxis protein methyltransferase CheR
VSDDDLETVEVDLLLEGVYRQYGVDFREYARASITRRLWRRVYLEGLETLTGLLERLLHDPACFDRLRVDLSIRVTAMFRDPSFYRAFRTRVVPVLRTYPFVRVWNAGCSTGEETFSLAILLEEEGLAGRIRMYATDMNEAVLQQAAAGAFPLEKMRDYTQNYLAAGGNRAFSEYYVVDGSMVRFHPRLTEDVVFAQHNLVSDGPFNEFHVIVCRNVLIYFSPPLRDRVHGLLFDSLTHFGIRALGQRESVRFTPYADAYEELDEHERLYRKAL